MICFQNWYLYRSFSGWERRTGHRDNLSALRNATDDADVDESVYFMATYGPANETGHNEDWLLKRAEEEN